MLDEMLDDVKAKIEKKKIRWMEQNRV